MDGERRAMDHRDGRPGRGRRRCALATGRTRLERPAGRPELGGPLAFGGAAGGRRCTGAAQATGRITAVPESPPGCGHVGCSAGRGCRAMSGRPRQGRPRRGAGRKDNAAEPVASWCVPCREEMPVLARYTERPGSVPVLGVNVKEPASAGLEFMAAVRVRYPSLYDGDETVQQALRVPPVLPVTYLVRPDGSVERIIDPLVFRSPDEIRATVDRLLSKSPRTNSPATIPRQSPRSGRRLCTSRRTRPLRRSRHPIYLGVTFVLLPGRAWRPHAPTAIYGEASRTRCRQCRNKAPTPARGVTGGHPHARFTLRNMVNHEEVRCVVLVSSKPR